MNSYSSIEDFFTQNHVFPPDIWQWINFDNPVTLEDLNDLETERYHARFSFDDDPLPSGDELDIPVLKDTDNVYLNWGGSYYIVRPKIKPEGWPPGPWNWRKKYHGTGEQTKKP